MEGRNCSITTLSLLPPRPISPIWTIYLKISSSVPLFKEFEVRFILSLHKDNRNPSALHRGSWQKSKSGESNMR